MNPDPRLELFHAHLERARAAAARLARRLRPRIDRAELEGPAMQGLWTASQRYDPERLPRFWTFAQLHVRGAMIDYLRERDELLRKTPSPVTRSLSALAGRPGERRTTLAEVLPGRDLRTTDPDLADELAVALRCLAPRERELMVLCYWEDLPLCKAGALLGISPQRAGQLHERSLERLRERLRQIHSPRAPAGLPAAGCGADLPRCACGCGGVLPPRPRRSRRRKGLPRYLSGHYVRAPKEDPAP